MRALKISNYGVRGEVGSGVTPNLVLDFGTAFGTFLGGEGTVVVGRDTRFGGEALMLAIVGGLRSTGCHVIDVGVVPTPVMQQAILKHQAVGGISLCASINPMNTNAIKFYNAEGAYLNSNESAQLIDIYNSRKFQQAETPKLGLKKSDERAIEDYLDHLAAHFDATLIASGKFNVTVDCSNGTAALILEKLAKRFGFNAALINNVTNVQEFSHAPNPNATNLGQLVTPIVKAVKGDLGVMFDLDCDRIAVAAETGEPVSEEKIICLIADYLLEKKPGGILLTNNSTTHALDEIVTRRKGQMVRCRVGRVFAIDMAYSMDREKIILIGEGTGAIMFPRLGMAFDGLATLLYLLSLLAERKKKLSEMVAALPPYVMRKAKVSLSLGGICSFMTDLRAKYQTAKPDLSDGILVSLKDAWFHVRSSQTEQCVRVIVEGKGTEPDELFTSLLHRAQKYVSV